MSRATSFILRPPERDGRIPVVPFKLDAASQRKASRFEFELRIGARYFAYGFAATADQVEEEWLSETGPDVEAVIFERSRQRIKVTGVPYRSSREEQFLAFTAAGDVVESIVPLGMPRAECAKECARSKAHSRCVELVRE